MLSMDDIVSTLLELPLYLDGALLLMSTWAVVLWAVQAGAMQGQWLSLTFRALTIVGHPQALREIFALRAAQGGAPSNDPQVAAMVEQISRRGMWFTSSCKEVQRLFKWAAFIGAALGAILLRTPEGALFMIALLTGLAFAQEFGRPVAFGLRKNLEPVLRIFPRLLYTPLSFLVDLPIFILSVIGGWVVLPLVWGVYLISATRLFTHLNRRSRN
jgi:hypothetical protein